MSITKTKIREKSETKAQNVFKYDRNYRYNNHKIKNKMTSNIHT